MNYEPKNREGKEGGIQGKVKKNFQTRQIKEQKRYGSFPEGGTEREGRLSARKLRGRTGREHRQNRTCLAIAGGTGECGQEEEEMRREMEETASTSDRNPLV